MALFRPPRPASRLLARAWSLAVLAGALCANRSLRAGRDPSSRSTIVTKNAACKNFLHRDGEDRAAARHRADVPGRSLPGREGMLFDFSPNQDVTMWMKNTYVLARHDLHPRRRQASCTSPKGPRPCPTTIISSRGRRGHVLEVVAGTAQSSELRPGIRWFTRYLPDNAGCRKRAAFCAGSKAPLKPSCWRQTAGVSTGLEQHFGETGYSAAR